jgi:RNA polymerase sigma-70 factor (ECF subfamily)
LGFQPVGAYMGVMDLSVAPAVRLANRATSVVRVDPDERVAAIYAAHFRQLTALATMLGGSSAVGEEIAQETFVSALKQERRQPGYLNDPVWPWLRITAVRLAGRSRQRLLRENLTYRKRGPDDDTPDAWAAETVDLVRALQRLPSRMRLCLILSHVEDQSTASIAAMLGCSTQNVETHLRKGRERMRTLLGERYNLNED